MASTELLYHGCFCGSGGCVNRRSPSRTRVLFLTPHDDSTQSMLIELLVAFAATLLYAAQSFRHFDLSFAIRLKRGRAFHFPIPIFGPESVRFTPTRRPRQ